MIAGKRLTAQKTIAVIVALVFLLVVLFSFSFIGKRPGAGEEFIRQGVEDTGAVNIVAAIYLNYRLFDTIFEILVFALAVIGVRFHLHAVKGKRPALKETPFLSESNVVRVAGDLLAPVVALISLFLIVTGHLTPGGGFSGGALLGTGILLLAVARGGEQVGRSLNDNVVDRLEQIFFVGIIALSLLPPLFGRPLLANFLPLGEPGHLLSSGWIPLYNLLIGGKVFIGIWAMIYCFIRHRGDV
ncbi:hypothetical protein LM597_02710 [Candidatus Acetothermia bacterium]|jgi:multicomponent Na+:H+ antiporter subunit B|nr:hypothetical protein [Candidatus Acetothermia bacterium]MCI2426310.1 hypothetical protein [Candidatus Acetothermia bacterium]MCI2427634.1 hypothetical protein [Candidatus Acetothermia bacterium]MCI2428483.1 hypothetical protein [Candidatus Acetothermia bacterium]